MSTPHAIAMPAEALAALRHYMGQAQIDAVLADSRPLTGAEQQQLHLELKWWREQHAMAFDRIKAITARLSDSLPVS